MFVGRGDLQDGFGRRNLYLLSYDILACIIFGALGRTFGDMHGMSGESGSLPAQPSRPGEERRNVTTD